VVAIVFKMLSDATMITEVAEKMINNDDAKLD